MTLKAVLDSVADLPEMLAAEYTQKEDGKWHLTPPENFKPLAEFNTVHGALAKERNDHRVTRTKLTAFGDLDPEQVRVQLERIPELETAAAGKLDETKINGIVEARVKQKLAPIERQRDTALSELTETKKERDAMKQKEQTRSLHELVRVAATKAGVQPVAVDDAIMLAERVFELDETGTTFVVKAGAATYTPGVSADVWLTQVKENRPHWWGDSGGGGARGSGGGNKGGVNPWSAENWNMTEQGRIYTQDRSKAEQLAKAAGTKIGGPKPSDKK